MGLYWVELSVCIIPLIIYNLLSPWTYPVLGNYVNLLVCVFYLGLLSVQYAQQIGIRALGKLKHRKTRFFSSLFKVVEFSKFSDLDFDRLRRFLSSIRVRRNKDHRNRSWNEPCRARRSFTGNLPEKPNSAGIQAWEDSHDIRQVGAESASTSSATSPNSDRIFSWQRQNIPLTEVEYSLSSDRIFR